MRFYRFAPCIDRKKQLVAPDTAPLSFRPGDNEEKRCKGDESSWAAWLPFLP